MASLRCPYEKPGIRTEADDTICMVLSTALGHTMSPAPSFCSQCIKDEWWNMGGVPQLKADAPFTTPTRAVAIKICTDHPKFAERYKFHLKVKLIYADCPRHREANSTYDWGKAFDDFAALSSPEEQRELFKEMIEKQEGLLESDGGFPAAELAEKLESIASKHELDDVLSATLLEG